MYSCFESLFKELFIQKYYIKGNTSFNESKEELKVILEYRKILDKVAIGMITESFDDEKIIDAMLKLARLERIIIAFYIIAQMELSEIAYIIDTSIDSTYQQKSTANGYISVWTSLWQRTPRLLYTASTY